MCAMISATAGTLVGDVRGPGVSGPADDGVGHQWRGAITSSSDTGSIESSSGQECGAGQESDGPSSAGIWSLGQYELEYVVPGTVSGTIPVPVSLLQSTKYIHTAIYYCSTVSYPYCSS